MSLIKSVPIPWRVKMPRRCSEQPAAEPQVVRQRHERIATADFVSLAVDEQEEVIAHGRFVRSCPRLEEPGANGSIWYFAAIIDYPGKFWLLR